MILFIYPLLILGNWLNQSKCLNFEKVSGGAHRVHFEHSLLHDSVTTWWCRHPHCQVFLFKSPAVSLYTMVVRPHSAISPSDMTSGHPGHPHNDHKQQCKWKWWLILIIKSNIFMFIKLKVFHQYPSHINPPEHLVNTGQHWGSNSMVDKHIKKSKESHN